MEKIDFKKEFKALYNPPIKQPALVDVPEFQFLAIDAEGDPGLAPVYEQAINALYSLAFTLKFRLKKTEVVDYSVAPLEGLWWTDDMAEFRLERKEIWKSTLLIMQPQQVTTELFDEVREQLGRKKDLSSLDLVRLEHFSEGLCAQVLHVGPYGAAEAPAVSGLHRFIEEEGYALRGKHHEIYLNDPRRTAPEKLRTVIRQPVGKQPADSVER
jgi:hypothetical protein